MRSAGRAAVNSGKAADANRQATSASGESAALRAASQQGRDEACFCHDRSRGHPSAALPSSSLLLTSSQFRPAGSLNWGIVPVKLFMPAPPLQHISRRQHSGCLDAAGWGERPATSACAGGGCSRETQARGATYQGQQSAGCWAGSQVNGPGCRSGCCCTSQTSPAPWGGHPTTAGCLRRCRQAGVQQDEAASTCSAPMPIQPPKNVCLVGGTAALTSQLVALHYERRQVARPAHARWERARQRVVALRTCSRCGVGGWSVPAKARHSTTPRRYAHGMMQAPPSAAKARPHQIEVLQALRQAGYPVRGYCARQRVGAKVQVLELRQQGGPGGCQGAGEAVESPARQWQGQPLTAELTHCACMKHNL